MHILKILKHETIKNIIKLKKEEIYIYFLKNNNVVKFKKLNQGEKDFVSLDMKKMDIIKNEYNNMNAEGIVLLHNHPNFLFFKSPLPSDKDIEGTVIFAQYCYFYNIELIDHIILCNTKKYFSFVENGLMC